jgi:hypothetical protein
MDLQPCAGCGAYGFEWETHLTEERDNALVAVYRGPCVECGTERAYEFELIGQAPAALAFGGPQPSRIVDPGQFFALAREAIAMAVSAIDEVGKFVPADADAVPPAAFTSEAGGALYAADPTQFRRARIEAVAAAYRNVFTAYQAH